MAGPRWTPVWIPDREWPLVCLFCGGANVAEPGHAPCVDCGKTVKHWWCPDCETEATDGNHFCTTEERDAYLSPGR